MKHKYRDLHGEKNNKGLNFKHAKGNNYNYLVITIAPMWLDKSFDTPIYRNDQNIKYQHL